jgi:hypothetical protein
MSEEKKPKLTTVGAFKDIFRWYPGEYPPEEGK